MSKVRRRQFLIASSALLAAHLARAQPPQKIRRIGYLGVPALASPFTQGVRKVLTDSLRRYGYEEGRNLVIEWRSAEGDFARLPALADELVRLDVELIATLQNASGRAAKNATRTIPIVMASSSLPVMSGLIESYARPGGNITGVDWFPGPGVADKGFEILKEAVPSATRAVRLWNPTDPLAHLFGDEHLRRVASNVGLTVASVEMTRAEDLPGALDRIVASRVELLYVSGAEVIVPHFPAIAAFAVKRKLVSFSDSTTYPAVGGLLHYGADRLALWDRVAYYIDRVLRGAEPRDLPVEQPSKFELVLNTKTAKAIGVTLPQSFMLRVTRVIE